MCWHVESIKIRWKPFLVTSGVEAKVEAREAPTIRTFSSNARNFDALRCNIVAGSNVEKLVW